MSPEEKAEKIPVRTSGLAKLLLIVMGIVLSFLLLGAVELVLGVIHYGPPRALFLKEKPFDEEYYYINRDISELFFPKWAVKPGFYERFPVVKKPNTIRILATGASTTLGDPFGTQSAFPNLLGQILRDIAPNRTYEIANCGVIAISSLDVLQIHKDALKYDPDAILIYCGHNEAYGADGIDSPVQRSFSSRNMAKAWLKFRNLRLSMLVRDILYKISGGGKPDDPTQEGFGMWTMRDRFVQAGTTKHDRMMRFYRENILEMLESARGKGVDVILCTLISNVRGQSPMGSKHPDDLAAEKLETFEDIYPRGLREMEAGNWSEAVCLLEACSDIDPEYAEVQFRLGRCYEAAGDSLAAFQAYVHARDLDVVHFRACSEQNEILRDIASHWDTKGKHRLVFLDIERQLYKDYPGGPGREFFTEHVHPYPIGHAWMAQEMARMLSTSEIAPTFGAWDMSRLRPPREYLGRVGMSNLDVAAGLDLTEKYKLAKWPFTECYDNAETREFIQKRIEMLVSYMNPTEQEVFKSIPLEPEGRLYDFGTRHFVLADQYRGQRLGQEALRELSIARDYWWPMVFVESDLALLSLALGRPDDAERFLDRARRLDPKFPAIHFVAGTLYHSRGQLQAAAQEFETYLNADPKGRFSKPAGNALNMIYEKMRGGR
ncbi:MAG: tetratricopeptide repeat protein [Candidatus Eisenbacteria bacterium]|uniref:Tetratricopeptide repeat protein n=1 Tax=Eiseniibacteriota bacterium TaxID=2212470 RepID=A0A948W2I2_UNCEI|nr:tetratricopeptide repeat protein [Candidatus Eisenbacteria bacterium]MBU1950257.1 tetratricopeptide repeat protein [Candidatus Eisenbacteria bacterium]MBU2689977.1 tetratricopeptide repeat protein [Candidatus Eisenbacteria bacterium]